MKISIITVTLNNVSVINHCLESVRKQTHDNIEHIVIDGASTDGTLSLLNYKVSQLATLISEPDNGIYDAMNKGLKIASGDIIGFLNSDDFYAKNDVLSTVHKTFNEDPTLGACYSDLVCVHPLNTNKIIRYWKSGSFSFGAFSKGWCPPHPTFFVKRSIYNDCGNFDVSYKIASDAELMMRFLEIKKIKVKYIPEVWVKFRLGGISNRSLKNIWKQNFEVLNALKKNKLSSNVIYFFLRKIITKSKQYIQRP
jgi:glycosyltransferase involved in cell wall biosynthesis